MPPRLSEPTAGAPAASESLPPVTEAPSARLTSKSLSTGVIRRQDNGLASRYLSEGSMAKLNTDDIEEFDTIETPFELTQPSHRTCALSLACTPS